MSRYIYEDDVIRTILMQYGVKTIDGLMDAIKHLPTAEVVPVVHGKWVLNENDDMFYCTQCKNGSVRNDYPYCHWCGALMDEVKE